MIWLAVIALAIWVLVEHNRSSRLDRELVELRRRLAEVSPAPEPRRAFAEPTPAMTAAARAAADAAAAALAEQNRAPQVSPPAPELEPAVAAEAASIVPEPAVVEPPPSPPPPPARSGDPFLTRASLEKWLAERGLAWIGGSALVIGGGFLVGYAAQQGFFTPGMRIIAAIVLGFALLGAGEAIRRGRLAGFGGHKLAAAVASGAGAAVLYGATWAAGHLYDFIPGGVCSGLLATIAWGLLGLAFLHGEALAVLALGGAFAAPLLAGGDAWSIEALTFYLGILIAAGAAIAWLRRWTLSAWTNLAGAAIWSLLAGVQQDAMKCLLIGAEPLAAIAVLAWVVPRDPRRTIGPGVVVVAAIAAYFAMAVADAHNRLALVGVIAGLALPAFTAALQRKGQVPAWSLVIPGVAFTLAAAASRLAGHASTAQTGVWCLQVLALDAATLWAAWREEQRATSGAGALSSLALALVAGVGLGSAAQAALGPAVAGVALALGALRLATDRRRPPEQRALELWGGGAAAALLATVALGLSWRWAAIGFAVASLVLALVARRLRWRSIGIAAAVGAALGLAALLNPTIVTHALAGGGDAWFLLGAGAGRGHRRLHRRAPRRLRHRRRRGAAHPLAAGGAGRRVRLPALGGRRTWRAATGRPDRGLDPHLPDRRRGPRQPGADRLGDQRLRPLARPHPDVRRRRARLRLPGAAVQSAPGRPRRHARRRPTAAQHACRRLPRPGRPVRGGRVAHLSPRAAAGAHLRSDRGPLGDPLGVPGDPPLHPRPAPHWRPLHHRRSRGGR